MYGVVDVWFELLSVEPCAVGTFEVFHRATGGRYSEFGMYSGDAVQVTLEGENSMVGVVIDRFGKDIPLRKLDEEHFVAHVEAAVSPQFFGWILSLNPGLKITAPESVLEQLRAYIKQLNDTYL